MNDRRKKERQARRGGDEDEEISVGGCEGVEKGEKKMLEEQETTGETFRR